jgi:hypothetical protein
MSNGLFPNEDVIKKGIHSCIRKPVDVDFLLEKLEQVQV